MGTKGIMVTAPVVAMLYDRTFLSKSFAEVFRRRGALYAALGTTWVVLVVTGVAAGATGTAHRQGATYGLGYTSFTPLEYARTQPGVILHYLKLAFWPHPLCLDYWWPLAKSANDVILPALVLTILLAGTLMMILRWSWVGFLGAWFFIILAPTSSFIPVQDPAFEHRMYLPLAAVVVLVVVGGTRLLRRVTGTPSGPPVVAGLMIALALVAVSSTLGAIWTAWATSTARRRIEARGIRNRGSRRPLGCKSLESWAVISGPWARSRGFIGWPGCRVLQKVAPSAENRSSAGRRGVARSAWIVADAPRTDRLRMTAESSRVGPLLHTVEWLKYAVYATFRARARGTNTAAVLETAVSHRRRPARRPLREREWFRCRSAHRRRGS